MEELRFETEFKGYDKEEEESYIRDKEAEHTMAVRRYEERIRDLEKLNSELKTRCDLKYQELSELEQKIETKYKGYIEHYDKIAGLVYESQVKADEIIKAAHEEEERILADAEVRARRRVDSVRTDVEMSLEDGRVRYKDIQAQIAEIVESLNAAQQKFMTGFREVHAILDEMPDTLDEHIDSEARISYASGAVDEAVAAIEEEYEEMTAADTQAAETEADKEEPAE